MHLRDFDYEGSGHVYFLTICTADKQSFFLIKPIIKSVLGELAFRSQTTREIHLYCYCIMPDHIHLLLSLTDNYKRNLPNWVAAFKRYIAREMNEVFQIKPFWQKNFYDHVVRKEEDLTQIAEYILNNPVRKGMAIKWEDYPYSRMVDPLPM